LTLHRPSNVDVPEVLAGILDALAEIQVRLPILFPAHPCTVKHVREFGFEEGLAILGDQTRRVGEGEKERGNKAGRVPELWDGRAAERIVETLSKGDQIV
jgi:hypothetical protein